MIQLYTSSLENLRSEKKTPLIGPAREGSLVLQLFIFYNQQIADRKKRMGFAWPVVDEVEFHHHLQLRDSLLRELLNSFAWSIANTGIP
jgi:hypothetical protein